jgi:hypothetical protein
MPRDCQLVVIESGFEICRIPIATARYDWMPKYWSNDYRNPAGSYKVAGIFPKGSPILENANAHHVPWYLSPTAHDPYEDAGVGVYGVGMITTDYPNREDLRHYENAKRNGDLRRAWTHFCENHLKPIYERISQQQCIPFGETTVETDYGKRTYPDLLETCPILDPKVAFALGVALHGTNDPPCIGTSISAGCIRMHNENIVKLMSLVEVGTDIEIEDAGFYSF